ncbi:alpha/beta fold hydrolase [Sphingomonas cavernae]|uniref:Alpha/beta fold hydrolase n=1 Tax=Sphingomonas cavernae TaxID=2320861 RepID=A0A418W7W5_9SPHN|nr:alpha/beta fold hydrolase [Sphingomonas cavernae]RJF86094.1 alpha/beta fold hydrolase [Sphingomonas cavernae]
MGVASEPSALDLTLLGAMALSQAGEDVPLPASKKTRALLAYLATSDRPIRRERLCELFWELPDDPRGALRWSLSKLRGVIELDSSTRLIADRETVQLDCSAVAVDWRALRRLSAEDIRKTETATLLAAAARGGEFLEGLELPRCDGFQSWLVAMRGDVRQWRVALLRETARRQIDPERALELAREWTMLDPYDALARVALIELLERTGRRTEADQQRALGIRKLNEGDVPIPNAMRGAARPAEAAVETEPEATPALPIQHVRFCTASDGTGLAYSVVGEGPALVKAANWLNHLEYDWDSPVWRHWLHAMIEHGCVVRYDERGNGLSDWNTASITFEDFVDDLASVVDAAGLDRFDLLGISQGGSVSIAYAVRHPERVRRLVLYGAYATGWRVRAQAGEIERREAMLTLTREGWGQNNPAFRQMFTSLFFPDASHEEMEWFNEVQRMSTSPANAEKLQLAFGAIDVRELLPEVRVPTIVLHARDDAVVPFAAGRAIAAAIPGAEFVALESRNHLLLEHEPAWPKLLERLREFLA